MITVENSIHGYKAITHGILFTHELSPITIHLNEYESDIVFKFEKSKEKGNGTFKFEPDGDTLNITLSVLEENIKSFTVNNPVFIGRFNDEINLAFSCYGNVTDYTAGDIMFLYTLWLKIE